MSRPQEPKAGKLIVGLLFRDFSVQLHTLEALTEKFGPMDFLTEPETFTYTNYYEEEMGPGIYRQVISFTQFVQPDTLPDIKLFTNDLEIRLSKEGKRRVNIDPGILSEERLILATGKDFTHRVYLRNGIYADLTLIYQGGTYRPLSWTYPDYRAPRLIHFLCVLRQLILFQRTGRIPSKPHVMEVSFDQ